MERQSQGRHPYHGPSYNNTLLPLSTPTFPGSLLKRISQRGFDYLLGEYPASNQIYIEPRSRIMFPSPLLFLANNIKVLSPTDRKGNSFLINANAISPHFNNFLNYNLSKSYFVLNTTCIEK